jgi:MSHA pilin protein MshC
VTCIVLIGVLAAVAAPRFFDMQPYNDRGYANEIAAALRAARQVAVASSCEVQVTVDGTGYQAWQRAAAAVGNTCNPVGAWLTPVRLSNGQLLAGTTPEGVAIAPATTQIVFSATGSPTAAPPTITVGSTFSITVDAFSGLVHGP